MADNILKQLYKNTESVSKDVKSMDTTLSKLLKLEKKQEKFDQKKHKEETSAKKKEARNEKRKKADFQGFKGLANMKKSEKDKEKKSLFEMLTSGLGGFIEKIGGAISGLASTLLTSLGGLGLGGIITGAMGIIGPALLAALGAFGLKILTSKKVLDAATENLTNPQVAEAGQAFGEAFGVNRDTYRAQLVERYQAGKEAEAAEILADRYAGREDIFGQKQAPGTMSAEELNDLKKNNKELDELINVIKKKNELENKLDKIQGYLDNPSTIPWYKRIGESDAELITGLEKDKNDHKAHLKTLHATLQTEKFIKIAGSNEMDMAAYLAGSTGYLTRQTGGHINVPGSGEGDKVPMLLPQGSFVLNKMASMHFQTGGMVPTLLEPGEKVFMPGDWNSAIEQLNGAIPRFQTGGYVGAPRSSMTDTGEVDYKNRKVLLSPKAAAGWEAMMAAGMPYNPQDITNVYRDAAEYQRLIKAGYGAASNSAHNFGEAADIHGAMNTWIRQNGMKYGWAANDYTGTHGGHFEYVGAGAGTNRANGEVEAAAESLSLVAQEGGNGLMDMAGGLMGGMGEALKGAFEGLSAFGEGFSEGFGRTVDKSNPIVGMISNALGGVSSVVSSIGNMFGGGGDNPFSNLFGGGDNNNASSPNGTGPIDMGSDVNAKLKKMAGYAMQAGFTKEQAKVMAAIAAGESTFNNRAHNTEGEDNSYGLWQINMLDRPGYMLGAERRKKFGLSSNDELFDPVTNAKAAKAIFDSGQGFNAWGAYTDGNAAKYMNAAKALKLQRGGPVPTPTKGVVSRKSSDLMSRMSQAQSKFSQGISLSVKPIIVYEDEKPVTVSAASDATMLPPDLPDGPGTAMAADYFYQLSLGNQ